MHGLAQRCLQFNPVLLPEAIRFGGEQDQVGARHVEVFQFRIARFRLFRDSVCIPNNRSVRET